MNPYKSYIETLFSRIIELRHTSSNINSILHNSIKIFENHEMEFISGSALIISDWTGPSDNGWEINYHTGMSKITLKDNYNVEIERTISQECCFAFAQSFEALERYLKDCVNEKLKRYPELKKLLKIKDEEHISRESLPGGEELFRWLKKLLDPGFSEISKVNNKRIKFKEFWTVLSQSRHAIIHSSSIAKLSNINKSDYHFSIFKYYFDYQQIDQGNLLIEVNYTRLDKLLKSISEFAFQIFKLLSINENLDWEILKK